ncbi:MAG TPA: hypothetical protein PLG99_11525, partial [Kaistiaceae bacterium]|nr:hypothetical protein [Kaistiaceae bacterium]
MNGQLSRRRMLSMMTGLAVFAIGAGRPHTVSADAGAGGAPGAEVLRPSIRFDFKAGANKTPIDKTHKKMLDKIAKEQKTHDRLARDLAKAENHLRDLYPPPPQTTWNDAAYEAWANDVEETKHRIKVL